MSFWFGSMFGGFKIRGPLGLRETRKPRSLQGLNLNVLLFVDFSWDAGACINDSCSVKVARNLGLKEVGLTGWISKQETPFLVALVQGMLRTAKHAGLSTLKPHWTSH